MIINDNLNESVVGQVSSFFYIICNNGTKCPCFTVVEGVDR